MKSPTPLLLLLLLLLTVVASGCGSRLSFKVDVYDIDSPRGAEGEMSQARIAYNDIHPPAAPPNAAAAVYLGKLKQNLAAYKDFLLQLNTAKALIFFVDFPIDENSSETDKAVAKKALADKAAEIVAVQARISTAFAATENFVNAEIDRLKAAPAGDTYTGGPELQGHIYWLNVQLGQQNIETDAERLLTLVQQLGDTSLAAPSEIKDLAITLAKSNKELKVPRAINGWVGQERLSPESPEYQAMAELGAESRANVNLAAGSLEGAVDAGDLVSRRHSVYQDLGDPFIAYIAAHPHWKTIPNGAYVSGDGDTEYMLVFERTLDGRWKAVSVDPSKVIQARLRMARAGLELVAAVGGVAASAFGVPIPKSGKSGEFDTMDYSNMTAALAAGQSRIRNARDVLSELREIAAERLATMKTATDDDKLAAARAALQLLQLKLVGAEKTLNPDQQESPE